MWSKQKHGKNKHVLSNGPSQHNTTVSMSAMKYGANSNMCHISRKYTLSYQYQQARWWLRWNNSVENLLQVFLENLNALLAGDDDSDAHEDRLLAQSMMLPVAATPTGRDWLFEQVFNYASILALMIEPPEENTEMKRTSEVSIKQYHKSHSAPNVVYCWIWDRCAVWFIR